MFVHRCVGKVTFVTCDAVLGAEGTTAGVRSLLERTEPDTLVLDLSVGDLEQVPDGTPKDAFLAGLAETVEPVAEEEVLAPYEAAIRWADAHMTDVRTIGPSTGSGWIQARKIKKAMVVEEGPANPEARARTGITQLLKDERVGELATRHKRNLAESLERVLEGEPPRTVVLFAFPWGEMVTTEVRRALGLKRVEGDALTGGWPT